MDRQTESLLGKVLLEYVCKSFKDNRLPYIYKIVLTIHSTQMLCAIQDYQASPVVEVEVIGIPADCCKFKTKMSPRNALSPMWHDTFEIEVSQRCYILVKTKNEGLIRQRAKNSVLRFQ